MQDLCCCAAGPVCGVRVARTRQQPQQQQQQEGESSALVVGPSVAQLEEADLSLLYCGTAERCTFLELQACILL